MSFKDQIRENYHEEPKEKDNFTFDDSVDEAINYVKQSLLDQTKSGKVKTVGNIIKKTFVQSGITIDWRYSNKQYFSVPQSSPRYYDGDLLGYTWHCQSYLMAKAFYLKIKAKCAREGIACTESHDSDSMNIRFTVKI